MSRVMFDTLRCVNRLKSAGVPDKVAEAYTEALAEALSSVAGKSVTEAVPRQVLTEELRLLERRLTFKLGSLMVAAVVVVVTLVQLI